MNKKYFIMLAFIIASVLFFDGNLQAQRLKQFKKMYETEISGYGLESYRTYCINVSRKYRVCKSAKSDNGNLEILIQENEKTVKKLESNIGSYADKFWVYKGNLDKRFSDELIVVDNNGVSNGLGVGYATVYIFSNKNNVDFQTSLKFPIEEFGENDNFIFDKKRNETLILATEWDNHKNFDPKRGWGLYLIGRWFRLKDGKLKPVFDKPNLARRYLFSFEKERWATLNEDDSNRPHPSINNYRPYLWLKNLQTHKYYSEPTEDFELFSTQTGIIEKYEETNTNDNLVREFTVRISDNKTIICRFGFPNFTTEKDWEGKVSIGDFGILPQKYMFPFNFSPKAIFNKLEGKKVKVETFKDDWGRNFSYFWFLGK